MGTELQYAINPLAASANNSFLVNQLSDCGYPLEIGARKNLETSSMNHFNHSVNEMFDLQNIESIKKTMLMQDDIFRRQCYLASKCMTELSNDPIEQLGSLDSLTVRELHQLYECQMKLMYELKSEMPKNQSSFNIKGSNHSGFAIWNQPIRDSKSDLPIYALRDDPLELSASCSGESPRMPKGFSLERIQEERPSTGVHGCELDQKGLSGSRLLKTNDGHDEEIDVELTLSIGCSRNKKTLNSQVNHCRKVLGSSDSNYIEVEHPYSLMKREKAQDKGDSTHTLSSSSAILNQNIAPSNWFFQDLSLNRT